MNQIKRLAIALISMSWLLCSAVYADTSPPPIHRKPFATHHIVLQISDGSPMKQNLVLNVAANLNKHYGSDKLDLEIVAFGPGLRLLLAHNVNAKRVQALATNYGVRFDACGNTLRHFTKKLGYKPKLDPAAQVVPAGAARIVQLETHGFALLRP